MKQKIGVVIGLAAFLALCFSSLPQTVFAEGGAGSGGTVSGGTYCANRSDKSKNCWDTTKISWVYYSYNGASDVTISNKGSKSVSSSTVSGVCGSEVGGFWHLGLQSYIWQNMTPTYQVGTVSLSSIKSDYSNFVGDLGVRPVTADFSGGSPEAIKYGTMEEVAEAFAKVKNYDSIHGTRYAGDYYWGGDLGWFCFSDKLVSNTFEGQTTVSSGSAAASTGFVRDNRSVNLELTNCANGCDVTFTHNIRRTNGDGASNYTIYKNGQSIESGSSSDLNSSVTAKIFTGDLICSAMTFIIENNAEAQTSACAYATGSYKSSINLKSKTSGGYADHTANSPLYVKPQDKISLRATYSPLAQTLYNKAGKPAKWDNSLDIKLINGDFSKTFDYDKGSADTRTPEVKNAYTITNTHVGQLLEFQAATTKNTPTKATATYSGGFKYEASKNTISDSEYIAVPYNFINTAETIVGANDVVYAGESVNVSSKITTNTRENKTTGGTYSTIVREAKVKLIVEQDGARQEYLIVDNGTLNESANSFQAATPIAISDLTAGAQVCFQTAVYPATSGSDTNLSARGDKKWAYSDKACYSVAKKPSFQVWGGGVYVDGNINNSTFAYKNFGTFGSWAELGVVANGGTVNNLASGTALVGSNSKDFCALSPLTFANASCANGKLGDFGLNATYPAKSSVADNYIVTHGLQENQYFKNSNNDYVVTNNIESAPTTPFLIYAKNIYIACNVTRVDAVLIAENTINTCTNERGETLPINDKSRSNPLIINGVLVAKTLALDRTYGAATRKNSGTPAEVINYNNFIYNTTTTNTQADFSGSDLYTVYQQEVAPRY